MYNSKKIFLCIVLITSFLFTGCNLFSNPSSVLTKYLQAIYSTNDITSYTYLSSKDKNFESETKYYGEYEEEPALNIQKAFFNKLTYVLEKPTITGDTAKITVKVTGPDVETILIKVLADSLDTIFSGKNVDEAQLSDKISKMFNGEIPLKTEEVSYNLVKEQDGWKVFLDLETQAKIARYLEEAKNLEDSEKYSEALAKYQAILDLDNTHKNAQDGIERMTAKIKEIAEKTEYISKYLKLENATWIKKDGYTRTNYIEISALIKNNGTRTLREVEVTFYYENASGGTFFEDKYYPVLVSDAAFYDFQTPLKPNYSRNFSFLSSESLNIEDVKDLSYDITNIEFTD